MLKSWILLTALVLVLVALAAYGGSAYGQTAGHEVVMEIEGMTCDL